MLSQCSESVSSPGVGGAVCSKNSSSRWRVYTYVSSAAHVNVRLERWPNAEKYAQKVINQVLAIGMRHEGGFYFAMKAFGHSVRGWMISGCSDALSNPEVTQFEDEH